MNDPSLTVDDLFDAAYAYHDEAERVATTAVVLAARSGAEFMKAKALCRHGEFEDRIERDARVSLRTAQLYMQLARGYPELLESKAQPVALLQGIRHAVALLAADDEVKAEVQTRLEAGETVSVREIEKLKREAQAERQAREKLTAELGQLQRMNQALHLNLEAASEREQRTYRELRETQEQITSLAEKHSLAAIEEARQERSAQLQTELESAQAQLAQLQAEISRTTEEAIQRGFQDRQAELDTLEQRKDALERMVAARMERFTRFNATLDANQDIADECAKLAVAFGGFTATVSSHEIPGLDPRTRAQAERVRQLIDGAARALDLLLSLPDWPREYEVRQAT